MSDKPSDRGFSAEQRASLLDAVRSKFTSSARRPASAPLPSYDVSFETLAAYRELAMHRVMGEALNLSNPFHRLHDMRAGARSRIDGKDILNFASYDYLGLNGDPEIVEAVAAATRQWGTSVSASRITAGERPFHAALEQALATHYDAESALAFVSGHAAGLSVISTLMTPRDLVLLDALSHNCLVLGAKLSGATRRNFLHNDLDNLESLLASSRNKHDRAIIVSEGLFSMDGDRPDLARLIEIKERWGCWLMVDDAHALGVLGVKGGGSFEAAGVDPRRIDAWYGTLSKTLVSCGGYVAGARPLIDFLRLTAPSMVYSVGMTPQACEAARVALDLMQRRPERVARLQANGRLFLSLAREAGLNVGSSEGYAITPVIVGDSLRTVLLAERLLARGVNAFPVFPPAVPEASARLRFFLSAEHTDEEIALAVQATREELTLLETEGASLFSAAKSLIARGAIDGAPSIDPGDVFLRRELARRTRGGDDE